MALQKGVESVGGQKGHVHVLLVRPTLLGLLLLGRLRPAHPIDERLEAMLAPIPELELAIPEVAERGEALDVKGLLQLHVGRQVAVDGHHVGLALQSRGRPRVIGLELLAVAAPRRVEHYLTFEKNIYVCKQRCVIAITNG